MRTLVTATLVAIVIITVPGAAAQKPAPAPQGRGTATAPTPPTPPTQPSPAPAPDLAAEAGQLVNVKIDLAVIEDGGAEPASRKEVSITLADRRAGTVRSGARKPSDNPNDKFAPEAWLNVDARPWMERRDGRVRVLITMQYLSPPHFSRDGVLKFETLLESGKPLVVSQASSAISDRRMRVELTATILK